MHKFRYSIEYQYRVQYTKHWIHPILNPTFQVSVIEADGILDTVVDLVDGIIADDPDPDVRSPTECDNPRGAVDEGYGG